MLDTLFKQFDDVDGLSTTEQKAVMLVRTTGEHGPIERFMRRLFVSGIVSKASDIHIEGRGDRNDPEIYMHVRAKSGLENYHYRGPDARHFETKMFQLCGVPQGGSTGVTASTRFSMALPAQYAERHGLVPKKLAAYEVDVRVEYVKTYDGFCFVSRLLDQQLKPGLKQLNLPNVLLDSLCGCAQEPSGLILVSGPTGSGKTTLLHAILDYLNNGKRSLATIENPVEYRLHGEGPIKQLQVEGEFTFARALRSILRCDPDVILLGEIRDAETMETAIEAAKTGHLVLATVHANNGHETFSRLKQLGADPLDMAEVLRMVIAQRLITRYEGGVHKRDLRPDERNWLALNGLGHYQTINESVSDVACGKASVVEAIVMDDQIKHALRSGRLDSSEIYRIACEQPQYESLVNAGVRVVESLGGRLKDCMEGLQSNSEARAYPGMRSRLSKENDLTLSQVARVVDMCGESWTDRNSPSLKRLLKEIKEDKWVKESI